MNLTKLKNKKISNTKSDVFKYLTYKPEAIPVFEEKKKIYTKKSKSRANAKQKRIKKANKIAKQNLVDLMEKEGGLPNKRRRNELNLSQEERRQIGIERKRLKRKKRKIRRENRVSKRKRTPSKYSAYIKSSQWINRRNKFWQNHDRLCMKCGSKSFLNVHHGCYENANFGKEPDEHLFALCQSCHKEFHDIYRVKKNMLKDTKYFIYGE